MSSGGIKGRPIVIDGKTAGDPGPATVTPLDITSNLTSPQTGRSTFARSLSIRNLDATNDLLVYLDGNADPLTVAQGALPVEFEATISRLVVASDAGTTQYEILAVVAA